jgi:hypothetical protein
MGKRGARGDRRFGTEADRCVYCGDASTDWEHVIPYTFRHPTLVVRACRECNGIASDKVFRSVIDKQAHIQARIRTRYTRFLKREVWDEDDMSEMGDNFKLTIRMAELQSDAVSRRVSWVLPPDVARAEDELFLALARQRLERSGAS